MIVRSMPDGWLVVRQADHARLAGAIVGLLRRPELLCHPRREALLRAVAEHDNGWWEEDAAPRLDAASGGPLDFRALPDPARRDVWWRGVERHAAQAPYVAALVAGHALRLAAAIDRRGEADDGAWPEFRDALVRRRDELLDLAGLDAESADRDGDWLALGDSLALALATGESAFAAPPPWRSRLDGAETEAPTLRLAPFDLAGATRFELEARWLPAAVHTTAVDLGVALATAPRRTLRPRLDAL